MTSSPGALDTSDTAWREIRGDSDIQFEPLPAQVPELPPPWLKQIGEFFDALFTPLASGLADVWPVLRWVLLAVIACFLVYVVWKLVGPYVMGPPKGDDDDQRWQPERAEALALLEDADRLAEAGDFSAAVHLLLGRSVGQIASARPDLVEPSSTARELAAVPSLPDKARGAFSTIAAAVERSLFALQEIGRDDWQQARSAYADFALERLD